MKPRIRRPTWLNSSRATALAVTGLLAAHAGLLAYSATRHDPTLNEPGHLVAGLVHWEFGRFEVYCVNPPLVHYVSATPVLIADYEADWSGFYDAPGARPEFKMGEDFIRANGERSIWLFTIARWACIDLLQVSRTVDSLILDGSRRAVRCRKSGRTSRVNRQHPLAGSTPGRSRKRRCEWSSTAIRSPRSASGWD